MYGRERSAALTIHPEDLQPGASVRTLEGRYAEVIDTSADGEWFPVVYRAGGEPDLVSVYEVDRLIPPPPDGLSVSAEDPAFATGPVERTTDSRGAVAAWRRCAEFVGGRWEPFTSISELRR